MNKKININNEEFYVNNDEFNTIIVSDEFNNLNILENLGHQERIISLLKELSTITNFNLKMIQTTHGGYIPIKVSSHFKKINISHTNDLHMYNIIQNCEKYKIENINLFDADFHNDEYILYNTSDVKMTKLPAIIICNNTSSNINEEYKMYKISNTNLYIYINYKFLEIFIKKFHYFINTQDDILNYDNLIHLTMIVKNAGDSFENVLLENLPIIDRWTILDTGSTDNTINIINKVLVGKKKGKLYTEPFKNFKDTRNKCLDIAGEESKFIIMLDDTYIIKEDLRTFLNIVRGDQLSNSFSLYIKSNDTEYASNRIIKSDSKLRYIYKMHEVITPVNNFNIIIPINRSYIFDFRSDYMEKRTMDRKNYDLEILFEMLREDPNDSRTLYYIGQTYNLLEKYELSLEYYLKRVNHPTEGFIQEKVDACFEAARISNFQLKRPWKDCEELYTRCYNLDKTRPESLYFIGIHYYMERKFDIAYDYLQKAFKIGYPIHCQYGLKPSLSYFYIPKFLVELSFIYENIKLGLECCELFLEKNKGNDDYYYTMQSWSKIFQQLDKKSPTVVVKNADDKPYICFVGEQENYIIEYIKRQGQFNVIVFYESISQYTEFIYNHNVHTCIITNYTEYLPVTYKSNVENVYLVLHDLVHPGEVIIRDPKLKNILCISESQLNNFNEMFKDLKDLTVLFDYGIDFTQKNVQKIPFKFIYSSESNNGLSELLDMWSSIIKRIPSATLYIHSNDVVAEENKIKGVFYEDKSKLINNWLSSDIWLYPCTSIETSYKSLIISAKTKTLAITSNYGILKESNGIVVDGNPNTNEWKERALEKLFNIIENIDEKNRLINERSTKTQSQDLLKIILKSQYNCNLIENAKRYLKFKKTSRVLEIGSNNILSKFSDEYDIVNKNEIFDFFMSKQNLSYQFIFVDSVCEPHEFLIYWNVLSGNGNMIIKKLNSNFIKKYVKILDADDEHFFLEKK
jgi:hypothetical protein